jgi:hypothetical protein
MCRLHLCISADHLGVYPRYILLRSNNDPAAAFLTTYKLAPFAYYY